MNRSIAPTFRSVNVRVGKPAWALALTLSMALLFAGGSLRAQPGCELVLRSFSAGFDDGASVYSGLVLGRDGVLYGTTWGGAWGGTVYRLNTDGSGFVLLHSFTNLPDGTAPFSDLEQGSDGVLYGTTFFGGISNQGTVFRITTNGADYLVLHHFTNAPDGSLPRAGLTQGLDGGLYGVTESGGVGNSGVVFRIDPDGSDYAILHAFADYPDGALPRGNLIQARDGALYGTTFSGGSSLSGTVFTIQTNGSGYVVLHHFASGPDGALPYAGLMQGLDGALYGTTEGGGAGGFGTVFRIDTHGGGYAVLHSFTNAPDGANPRSALVQASDGTLYGTTSWGGNTNGGSLFRIRPDGSGYAVLHHFDWAGEDGSHPWAGLVGGETGWLYGTTLSGGTTGFGTVYRFALLPTLHIAWSLQGPQLTVTGSPGQACELQSAPDLVHWDTLTSLVLTNGTGSFLDAAYKPDGRFYRVHLQ